MKVLGNIRYYEQKDNVLFINKDYKARKVDSYKNLFAGTYHKAEFWMLENLLIDMQRRSHEIVELPNGHLGVIL